MVTKSSQGDLVTKTNPHADTEMLNGRVDGLEVKLDITGEKLENKLDSSIKNLKSRMDEFR